MLYYSARFSRNNAHWEKSNISTAQQHQDRRRIWQNKYAIRACYRGWYKRMQPFIVPGFSLEVGAGCAPLKDFWSNLTTTDYVQTFGIDLVADGHALPVRCGAVSNLVAIDLLHHLRDPHIFLDEAARVLRPGGRLLMIEPYITPLSYLGYRCFHHETICFDTYQKSETKDDPWEGNLAMANIVFRRERSDWVERHPLLKIIYEQPFSVLDFQLACGFKPYALVNRPWLYDALLWLDRRLDAFGKFFGFRIFCAIEKCVE